MIGLVYAGGMSVRFGEDKATYQVPGLPATNIQLAVKKLSPLCQQVIVCANEHNQAKIKTLVGSDPSVIVICDLPSFHQHGPLSAIIACTARFKGTQDYLAMAVDYPYIQETTLSTLEQNPNSYIRTDNHDHYSLAHFSTSNDQVIKWVNHGDWRLHHFIVNKCGCQPLSFPATTEFSNLNYREVN